MGRLVNEIPTINEENVMKIKWFTACLLMTMLWGNPLVAEEIVVGLEPLPPLITKDRGGYTVELLKEVEKISDMRFTIKILPYVRARIELEKGGIHLMGHTPYELETKEFYTFAQELEWKIDTVLDIYSVNKAHLAPETFKTMKKIATPRGNEAFLSETYGIPAENFFAGNIDNLLRMVKVGRVDLFFFERASSMSSIRKLKIDGMAYRLVDRIGAGLAVRKDDAGTALKNRLDSMLKKVDRKKILSEYTKYLNMPESGIVGLSE